MKFISKSLVYLLFLLSFVVALNLCWGKGLKWEYITAYWVTVAIKHAIDWVSFCNDKED